MSAAHRHTTPDPDHNSPAGASSSHLETPHTDSRVDDASPPSVSPTEYSSSRSRRQHPCQTQSYTQSTAGHTRTQTDALTAQIEQTQLRTRVAALERELAASRRNQQAIVDQYERVLEDRECCAEKPDRETESTAVGQRRTDDGSDDARSRAESESSSGSDSKGSIAELGAHVRRALASVSR
ncbi:hypothetical protein OB955_05130 [Halobacteria archaeon AArc-m2/3/4]|uniref:Uncharacterized protein n=1 Tax=Natronoglomus mannanivorans TaxID=2979990 RepID=A0ABT2QB30_9EURY|nr:hypothetical protein [Halobacteria archaeon AArc-m2/3/4]